MEASRGDEEEENVLCRILHLEAGRHTRARRRRAASRRLHPVDFLQIAGGIRVRGKLEPRHGGRVVGAPLRIGRRAGLVQLGARGLAEGQVGAVEIKEGRGRVLEVVQARDGQVGRPQDRRLVVRQGELQGQCREHVDQVRVRRGDAAGVEERGQGADLDGRRGRVGGVAGVVLRAAADGYVLQCQPSGRRGEGNRSCELLVGDIALDDVWGLIPIGIDAFDRSQTGAADIDRPS
jgi:hypothetical protein